MISKIITKTYFTKEIEMEKNVKDLDNVINAEVVSFGKDKEEYFVETKIKYRGKKINE